MKKVIKSKIFLVIICGIIFTSLGVYAATTYKASDVIYNSSNGTSMTVSEALNELYKSKNSGDSVVYYLGDGTTFDIKTLLPNVDYTSLTVDNFIVKMNETKISSKTIQTSSSEDLTKIVRHINNATNFTKTYSDGVFTVTSSTVVGKTMQYSTDYGGSWKDVGSVSYQACGGVYLVIGNINKI